MKLSVRALSSIERLKEHQEMMYVIEEFETLLKDVDTATRHAEGQTLGWMQGRGQMLEFLLNEIRNSKSLLKSRI